MQSPTLGVAYVVRWVAAPPELHGAQGAAELQPYAARKTTTFKGNSSLKLDSDPLGSQIPE